LVSVVVPESVVEISVDCFGNCDELTDVYFLGLPPKGYFIINAFQNSHPEYISLHVLAANKNAFSSTEPWNNKFKEIVVIDEATLKKIRK
jgi:hypothetical protein